MHLLFDAGWDYDKQVASCWVSGSIFWLNTFSSTVLDEATTFYNDTHFRWSLIKEL
jgi:hypothetical protein